MEVIYIKYIRNTNDIFSHTINECIRCNKCTKYCDFLTKYKINLYDFCSKPSLSYSCFLCNKCYNVCPKNLSGKDIAIAHRSNEHKYYLITNLLKNNYIFKRLPKKYSEIVLYTGCNYPAFYPKTCASLYRLCSSLGIEIITDCCKKPMYDNGENIDFHAIEKQYLNKGISEIICMCPNCYHLFKSNFKNIKITSIYKFLTDNNLGNSIDEQINIFFPCSDRYNKEIFNDILPFLSNGYIDPFRNINCCGLGGGARKFEPDLVESNINKIKELNLKNIYTYCSSCSGIFSSYNLANVNNILSKILGINENVSPSYLKNVINNKFKRSDKH